MTMLLWLTVANLKMTYRNKQALFWSLAFPLIFVTSFGLFNFDDPPNATILLVDQAQDAASQGFVQAMSTVEHITVEERSDAPAARREVDDGDFSYLLIIPDGLQERIVQGPGASPSSISLVYDRANSGAPITIGVVQGLVEEMNKQLANAPTLVELQSEGVQSRQLTYYDFLLPGLVGMGVMTSSIVGISASMALYRQQRILKRILATPLRVRVFFASEILANLVLAIIQAAIILAAGILLFGANIYGNFLWVFAVVLIASIVFLNIGFIIGGLSKNVDAAVGLANAVSLPMMFLAGVFFPKEGLPWILSNIVSYLPLAPMLDALRGVALEAEPLWNYPFELGLLGAWIVVSAVVAVRVFRFE